MELFGVYFDRTLLDTYLWLIFVGAVIIFLFNALYYKFNFNEPIIKYFAIQSITISLTIFLIIFLTSDNIDFLNNLENKTVFFGFDFLPVFLAVLFYFLFSFIHFIVKFIIDGFSSESQSSEKSYRKFSSYEEAVRVQNYKPKSFRQMLNDYFWIIVIVVGILIMTILYYIYSPYQNCVRNYGLNSSNKELSEDTIRDALGRDLTKEEKHYIYSRNVQKEGWNNAIKLFKKEYKKYCSALNSW